MTTRRTRSVRPRARSAARARGATSRASPSRATPFDRRRRLAEEPVELLRQAVEDVALGRGERGPGREVADVARRHRERVRHQLREVARRSCRGGSRSAPPPGSGRSDRRGGAWSARTGADRASADGRPGRPRAGRVRRRRAGDPSDPAARDQGSRVCRARPRPAHPARASRREFAFQASRSWASRVVACARVAGSTLAAVSRWANGLRSLPTPIRPSAQAWSGRRAAPGERVEDDVARPRVAGDEGVGQGRREAREVRAHRVEGVAPQALLVLPLGREGDRRQLERKLEGELARGRERAGRADMGGPGPPCPQRRSRSVRGSRSVARANSRLRACFRAGPR